MNKRKALRPLCWFTMLVIGFVYPVRSATLSPQPPRPDMPLPQLMNVAVADISQFWVGNFSQARRRYAAPNVVPYTQPILTPCGRALLNNAFYCSSSNSIYVDINFLNK